MGLMGAGKTTIGRSLAKRLNVDFIDSDREIEARTGVSIPTIFEIEGEDGFRKREAQMIADLSRIPGRVIATGGGVVLDRENVDRLKQRGFLIWLDADVQTIIRRIQADSAGKQQRPPLSGYDLNEETITLLQERIPFYRRAADFSVDTANRPVGEIVDEIYRRVKEVLPCQEAP